MAMCFLPAQASTINRRASSVSPLRALPGRLRTWLQQAWKTGGSLHGDPTPGEPPPRARDLSAEFERFVHIGDRRQWYFTACVQIPNVQHKVRIVMLWKQREDAEAAKMVISNRTTWEVSRILLVYRYRWTGTETFHRDGKQQLGMGDCQLRDSEGQTRHMHLVMLAYSLLMQQLQQSHAREWAYQKLTTIGEACRAILRETLRKTLTWAIDQVTAHAWDVQRVMTHLNLAGAPGPLS